jgi:hypothetical protein
LYIKRYKQIKHGWDKGLAVSEGIAKFFERRARSSKKVS